MDNSEALLVVLVTVFAILLILIILFVCCCYMRRRSRYNRLPDTSINDDPPLIQRFTQPRIERTQVQEQSSLLTCHFYIRTAGGLIFHSQLSQLGFDPEKSWFLVTPIQKTGTTSSDIASQILTIQPKSDRLTHLIDEESTAIYIRTLNSLFSRLHHPYVEPLIRVDILYTQKTVVVVKKYQRLGSLKDLLHGVQPTAHFHGKYSYRSSGLSLDRVRTYSRQLLEGLLFLQSKSMPPIVDLHSGNIIATGSSVQIGGYEYQLLEQRSRIHPLIRRATSSLILSEGMTKGQASEVFCFGGIIFEMLSGYELGDQIRGLTPKHWHDCGRDADARQMLTRVLDVTQPVLTLSEIRQLPYFSNPTPKLKELQTYTPMSGDFSPEVKTLLEQWATTSRKKRASLARSTTLERKKNAQILRPGDTAIINLSYTPMSPITPLTTNSNPIVTASTNIPSPTTPTVSGPPPPPPPPAMSAAAPPPPPPPPAPAASGDSGDRNALLGDIRAGMKLKKTVTNDRSGPKFK